MKVLKHIKEIKDELSCQTTLNEFVGIFQILSFCSAKSEIFLEKFCSDKS